MLTSFHNFPTLGSICLCLGCNVTESSYTIRFTPNLYEQFANICKFNIHGLSTFKLAMRISASLRHPLHTAPPHMVANPPSMNRAVIHSYNLSYIQQCFKLFNFKLLTTCAYMYAKKINFL